MQNLLFCVGIAIAVLGTAHVLAGDNHQVSSGNLKDYYNYNAFSIIPAYRYKCQDGAITNFNEAMSGEVEDSFYVQIDPRLNATLVYSLDFGTSENATSISLGLAAECPSDVVTKIDVYVDSPSTTPIATLYLTNTVSWLNFANFTATVINAPRGIHDVYFIFTPSDQHYYFYFDWLAFNH